MRIISGRFKGRRFHPPATHWPTRPTTDFAKENLFNILQHTFDFESMRVLDLFGGTGSHSYEFISRGCRDVTYVDKFADCVRFVKKTAAQLGITDQLHILHADVFRFLDRPASRYDYVFAGPPYALPTIDLLPDLVLGKDLLHPGGWFVLEHNAHHDFANHPKLSQCRVYGGTIFSIFEQESPQGPLSDSLPTG